MNPKSFLEWDIKTYETIFEKQRRVQWEKIIKLLQEHKQKNEVTIIPENCSITGGINTTFDVNVYGEVNGVILNTNLLIIGKTGKVTGVIKAKNVIVCGTVDAKVLCENIEVLSTGKVIGEVKYRNLKIEKDAVFEAKGTKEDFEYQSDYLRSTQAIQKVLRNPLILDDE